MGGRKTTVARTGASATRSITSSGGCDTDGEAVADASGNAAGALEHTQVQKPDLQ